MTDATLRFPHTHPPIAHWGTFREGTTHTVADKNPADEAADKAKNSATDGAKNAANAAREKAGGIAGGVTGKAGDMAGKAGDMAGKAAGKAGDAAGGVTGKAAGAAGAVGGAAAGLGGKATGAAAGLGGKATGTVKGVSGMSTKGSSGKGGGRGRWLRRNKAGQPWKRPTAMLGLLPLLGLIAFTLPWAVDHIEDDLEDATIVQMRDEYGINLTKDQIDFDGRDGEITNFTLPEGVTNEEIEEFLEARIERDGGAIREGDTSQMTVRGTEAAPAPTGSHDVRVAATGDQITLTGDVLNQAEYDELQAAAVDAVGEANVTNNLNILDVEASKSGSAARVAGLAGAVALMTGDNIVSGDAHLTDDALDVNAIAVNEDAKAALEGAVGGVEGVDITDNVTVAAPDSGPLDVQVSTDGASITLDGTVLTENQHDALVSAAEAEVGAANVTNNLTISNLAEMAPNADGKVADMAALFDGFDGLVEGSGSVTDGALTFTGVASDEASKAAIDGLVGTANDTNNVDVTVAEVTVEDEVGLLQAELDALQAEILENVVFDVNSDVITPTAAATLDKVVAAMTLYQRPAVLVGGHTDSDGDDAFNLDLSDRRAKSVSQYIADQGIDINRLRGQGFGETEPVAANDTPENKQQNRRVEFTALAEFTN